MIAQTYNREADRASEVAVLSPSFSVGKADLDQASWCLVGALWWMCKYAVLSGKETDRTARKHGLTK
ncbi:hypothetical protein N183_22930 [Sinorhizobium sp. Sb3]|nr:hypothetical protein N183_22930 [Sinorhizobium sp. Sb3]